MGETGSQLERRACRAAAELLERSRSIFERVFGPSHSEVEVTKSALARFAELEGEGRKAKKPRLE